MKKFSRFAIPYFVWMGVLCLFPTLFLLILSLKKTSGIHVFDGYFTLSNYQFIFTQEFQKSLSISFVYAFLTTFFCLLLGYPTAYLISHSHFKNRFLVLCFLILPMWSNTLLRTNAISAFFQPGNILSSFLTSIGLRPFTLDLYGTAFAVVVGMVSTYLPFMILPIYTAIEKIDPSLYDAASDLGASKPQTFLKVTLPISLSGVASGVIMVFLPACTNFGVAEKLGVTNLLGSYIEQRFATLSTYGVGAMVSVVLLVVVTVSMLLLNKVDKEGETLL
jgi:spermidine/putrescine transport system permease protein